MEKKILVADDDPHIRQVIVFALQKAGMLPIEAKDGQQAVQLFEQHQPSLIILDINMPELDGLEVCKAIRKTSEVPILFLSSRDDEVDKIIGLEIGGDDYVTKPFSPRELVARVNVILKRVQPVNAEQQVNQQSAEVYEKLTHGLLVLEPETHQVFWGSQLVKLTAMEFSIIHCFMRRPEKVFDRDSIMNVAYDMNIHVSGRTIDSHIRHIRNKFQQAGCELIIETVHGVGYRLAKKVC
ncbi:response regulator transcription factor [Endozoicomonas sp. SM1973]|uniref:Response regulator transcription factor n=1 Tax=Spartinivicinus marinus TaxID=2994442 RepID=A0A853I513_9GAMM|nr:response regulator transcription factor [Spartinivicinus marinus]MCX4027640.1 response regulator transcription factor [Spartinivicinus marinus]NYZ66662.1 response regulator transcription factor [Spartinivicinus marinus]